MTFTIPSDTFNNYFEAMDEFINNPSIGIPITLYFQELVTANTGNLNLVDGPTPNIGPDGNLLPFNQFGGTSTKQVESTQTIRVRWYPDPKTWKKLDVQVNIQEIDVMMIGYMTDYNKLIQCNQIGRDLSGHVQKFVLADKPIGWGFQQNGSSRYFVAKLKAA